MPSQPTLTRLNNVLIGFTAAVSTLEVLSDALPLPFLEPISRTSRSLLTAVENIKQNKGECAQLMEQTSGLLYAIVSIHVKSTTGPELSPSMFSRLGKFTETLHKVHTYVEAQQDKSKIRQFFRPGEVRTLLKACHTGLREALEGFKVLVFNSVKDQVQDVNQHTTLMDIQRYAEDRHQEVLQLIEGLSDDLSLSSGLQE
ncbi:hypothetical protein C8R43DRAFT_1174329 [Mycena crocata]|nr:hypothetical protein C8R43DRAFT_1174329 [Mycena crocata]